MTLSRRSYALISAAIVLAGFLLRLAPMAQNRFHEDEALYAAWSRQIAAGLDPLLNAEPVDKPPLLFYVQALSFLAFGPSEVAARLPNLIASLAALLALRALAGRLYGRPAALLAILALALNPFDIAFAGTAFTDPLMTAWVMGGLALAAAGRAGWAGVCLGLAFAAKQQGAFFIPLALGLGALVGWASGPQSSDAHKGRCYDNTPARLGRIWARLWRAPLFRGALGWLAGAAPALLWDIVRTKRPGYLEQSLLSYGGLQLAAPALWGERLRAWQEVLRLAPGWPLVVVAGGMLALAVSETLMVSGASRGKTCEVLKTSQVLPSVVSLLLIGFILLYLLGHALLTFRAWDRYLLGLIPLLALLAGRLLTAPARLIGWRWPRLWAHGGVRVAYITAGAALLLATLWPAAATAARGAYPAGGDHGAYQGIEQVAAYVRAAIPADAIIHQRRLGWHLRYYLWGYPQALRWYENGAELRANATEWPAVSQWLIARAWDGDADERAWLEPAGLTLHEAYRALRPDGSVAFRIYRLGPP